MFSSNNRRTLDHTSLMVRDFNRVAQVIDSIGCTLSPFMGLPDIAIENRILVLGQDAIDFMTIQKRGVLLGDLDGVFDTREGLFGLIFQVDDKQKVVDAELGLKGLGFQTLVVDGKRPEVQSDGSVKSAHWTMCGSLNPKTPLFRIFVCHHYDPDIFFNQSYANHHNGAKKTASISAVAQNLNEWLETISFLFGSSHITQDDQGFHAAMNNDVTFHVYSPEGLAEVYDGHIKNEGYNFYMTGQEIRVQDIGVVASLLKTNAIDHHFLKNGKVLIPPHVLSNVAWTLSGA